MTRALAAMAVAILTGCAELQVDIVFVDTEEALRAQCGDDMLAEPLGCALSHGRSCTIVAYRPRSFDDHRRVETMGHELFHCIAGPAHL